MNIREKMNARPAITAGVAFVILVVALVAIYFQWGRNKKLPVPRRAFFTIDDGQSYFVDDINKIPPFDHEGKTAYRCYVFTADGGATKFVGRLERYTPQGKAQVEEMLKNGGNAGMPMNRFGSLLKEIKAPGTGDKDWIPAGDPRAASLLVPQAPDGTSTNVKGVTP